MAYKPGSPPPPDGTVGRSQVTGTYGVGSIYELRTHTTAKSALHSVMMAGLDYWPPEHDLPLIREPYLERILGVRRFVQPPAEGQGNARVPSVRFPSWLVCTRCHRLGIVGREFDDVSAKGPRCLAANCGGGGVPARLVAACYAPLGQVDEQPGHIEDFPWVWWAHSKSGTGRRCGNPQLKLEAEGKTASLAGLVVRCHSDECGGKIGRSLEGVFGEQALATLPCTGNRPWLGDRAQGCNRRLRAMLRGASNVYFPLSASAISIPPTSSQLAQMIANRADSIVQSVGAVPMATLIQMTRNSIRAVSKFSDDLIANTLILLSEDGLEAGPKTEAELRERERQAIILGRTENQDPDGEFIAIIANPLEMASAGEHFAHLVQVHRLREVRALRGFQRVTSSPGGEGGIPMAPLSRKHMDWLPATEVHGEGVFFELSPTRVHEWQERDEVLNRVAMIMEAMKAAGLAPSGAGHRESLQQLARLVLVHTLSHLLMTQFAVESGYSGTALRERLYVGDRISDDQTLGVLIYTATSGSDGTLGGLVRHGQPARFERALLDAIENGHWCSSDPLCIESNGQGLDALNLAACHACGLVPETACEMRNTLLDRGLVVGTPEHPDAGFFHDLGGL